MYIKFEIPLKNSQKLWQNRRKLKVIEHQGLLRIQYRWFKCEIKQMEYLQTLTIHKILFKITESSLLTTMPESFGYYSAGMYFFRLRK